MNESENRLSAIFAAAMEIADAKEREDYLARACGTDNVLRQQVEELLQADAQAGAGRFLPDQPMSNLGKSLPWGSVPGTATQAIRSEKPGDRIGRYKLLEKIGEGGCGLVYMAEQEEPVRRKVALKVIKLGMDTRSVVARFETERQALALMDHPNIAKVFDAGSTELGRPYFVMELVKGVPITRYCDENKLNTAKRLGLFVQVCQAVQHAHQKGIIHRDLKPSNILIADHDGLPVPKIIDFGIAKATTDLRLTDKTLFTALEQFIGTPAYMSPEQAKLSGLDIDTRSDIYSLGVLLYELLTGNTPFDPKRLLQAGLDGIRRIIREEDPPRPSARLSTLDAAQQTVIASRRGSEPPKLLGTIRGDLDWIVMKCLEKNRTRRYETANGLAADLTRHLKNEPVVARPPDAAYRFKKALDRHRLLFLGIGAVAATLVLGISVSSWQAIRARRAEAHLSVLLKQEEQARHESERQRRQALENEERALSLVYASDLQAVQQAIDGGRLERARALLKRQVPGTGQRDRRGFEWYYYWQVTKGQQTAVLLEQTEPLDHLIVAPDGKTVVLQDGKEIKTFDLARREVAARWPWVGRRGRVSAISPDGRQIALLTTNGVELLNTIAGQTTTLGTGHCYVVSFATDRPWIAMCPIFPRGDTDRPTVQIWDYEKRQLVQILPNGGGPMLWWETNSTVIASLNHEGSLERWEPLTGALIQKVAADPSRQEFFPAPGAVSSERSKGVVFVAPGLLRVFDPADGRVLSQSLWPVHRTVALSADGRMVAVMENARIRLANTASLQDYDLLAGHLDDVTGVDFVGSTSNLVSCAEDGRLLLWERKEKFLIPFTAGTNEAEVLSGFTPHVALSADQRYCAVYLKLWSLPSGAPARSFTGSFLGFSPDGTDYATATSSTLQVWKCADAGAAPVSVFPLPASATNSFGMSLSADGRFGTCATWDNHNLNVLVFAARSGQVLASAADQAPVGSPKQFPQGEFLPASNRMAVSLDPGSAIWDWQVGTNGAWLTLPGDLYGASPDGHWLVLRDASRRHLTLIAEGASPKIQIELEGHNDSIVSVAFSHDELTLASVDIRSEVRLWKLPEGQLMGIIPTSVEGLPTLAFSIDDQRLYIAGRSGVQVLEAPKFAQTLSPASFPKPGVNVVPPDSVWSR